MQLLLFILLLFFIIVLWIVLTSKQSSTFQDISFADIVIIGAGTAGCILANRLHSKHPTKKILILERGQDRHDDPIVYNIKNGAIAAFQEPYSEVLPSDFPEVGISLAKLYGGASSHNYALVVHGSPEFYNGLVGLSYDQYVEYFKRIEAYQGKSQEPITRGHNGKLQVSQLPIKINFGSKILPLLTQSPNTIYKTINTGLHTGPLRASPSFSDALSEIIARTKSVPIVEDYNTSIISCVSSTPQLFVNSLTGLRSSTDVTYLPPNDATLLTINGATVNRINDKQVEWTDQQGKFQITSTDKIILCAGAIYTPRILQKSGFSNVGNNLITHYGTTMIFAVIPNEDENFEFSSGPLAFVPRYSRNTRDWQIITGGQTLLNKDLLRKVQVDPDDPKVKYISFLLWNLKPRTRGSVGESIKLRLFEDGGLDDPNSDLSSIVDGARWMYQIVQELNKIYPSVKLVYPPPHILESNNNQILSEYVITGVTVTDHYSATCALGSIVDPINFLLKGTHNIHVVDASVLPKISDGNTEFPVVVMAELASDRI